MLLSDEDDARAAVKISDFGLARQAFAGDEAMGFSTRLGTVVYAAPEILDAQTARDGGLYDGFAADVWSLGITICELGSAPAHPVPRQRDLLDRDPARRNGAGALGAVGNARLRALLEEVLSEEPARRPNAAALHERLVADDAVRRRFAGAITAAMVSDL